MYLALSVLLGTAPIFWLKTLPQLFYIFTLCILLFIFLYFIKTVALKKIILFIFLSALMFLWTIYYCHKLLSWTIDPSLEGKPLFITGTIVSLVQKNNLAQHFIFKTESINNQTVRVTLKLSSNLINKPIYPGDQWQWMVALVKPHGNLNPGGFDLEKWYFINHIRATGKVVESSMNKRIATRRISFNTIRQFIYSKLNALLKNEAHYGVLSALIIGDHSNLTELENTVFRQTGTAHLMAISGLHVGLVSAGCFFLAKLLLGFFPNVFLYIPRQRLSAVFALIGAVLYCGLAGFSFSTQRSLIMLICALMRYWLPWKMSMLDAMSMAFVLVLIIHPLAILDAGFWLSFMSVAILAYGIVYQESKKGFWDKWGRAQWVCSIGLFPITSWYFQQIPLLGFFANLVAIPWVSFIVVPLAFLGIGLLFFSSLLSLMVIKIALFSFSLLFHLLQSLSQNHFVFFQSIPQLWILLCCMGGVLLLLSSLKMKHRFLGFLLFIPFIFVSREKLQLGESSIHILDVGQGLGIVVQTKNHVLIFDTGAKMNEQHDAGKDVIVPFLRYKGIRHIDKMVLSHGDNDHIGGARSILAQFKVGSILTSAPQKISVFPTRLCRAGQQWDWDGLHFQILNPTDYIAQQGNNASCVLKLSGAQKSVLFTADIEESTEKRLTALYGNQLRSTVLIVPHHGSKTSSHLAFLNWVKPKIAVFSYGYRNRYHHPSMSVVQRYSERGVRSLHTVSGGAIEILLGKQLIVKEYRKNNWHIWFSKT